MTDSVTLRDVTEGDLEIFFEHQGDPEANRMAAFPARELDVFLAHWNRMPRDGTVTVKTILLDGHVAGNVVSWVQDGETLVGYWIGKEFWGRGVATRALLQFLQRMKKRPLAAHVAAHNAASIRVLEKCGFTQAGKAKVPFGAPGEEVDELIYRLGKEG